MVHARRVVTPITSPNLDPDSKPGTQQHLNRGTYVSKADTVHDAALKGLAACPPSGIVREGTRSPPNRLDDT